MAWIPQKELDAAVDALIVCANSLTTHNEKELRIKHCSQDFDRKKWESVICAAIASAAPFPDTVLPSKTYLLQGASQNSVTGY